MSQYSFFYLSVFIIIGGLCNWLYQCFWCSIMVILWALVHHIALPQAYFWHIYSSWYGVHFSLFIIVTWLRRLGVSSWGMSYQIQSHITASIQVWTMTVAYLFISLGWGDECFTPISIWFDITACKLMGFNLCFYLKSWGIERSCNGLQLCVKFNFYEWNKRITS